MTDSGDESAGAGSNFPGLPIPYSALKRHVRYCEQPRCFAQDMSGPGAIKMLADATKGRKHWLQLAMPKTRSVVYHPDEEAHQGHRADRESILVTHAILRLTCSCSSPACCLPSLLNRLCANYNRCAFDHDIVVHRGHLSSDRYRSMAAPARVKLIASLLKAAGLVLALFIAGLTGYLVRRYPSPAQGTGGGAIANATGLPPQQPLTLTLDTGTLSGLEIILLCAILAVTLGALSCLFRPTVTHLLEQYLLSQPPLLTAEQVDLGGGGPPGIETQLRPPSPSRVRLN